MKKVVVLTVALAVMAVPAFALTIKNSKHDLSKSSTATIKASSNDEICVFCHTPHSAAAAGFAPLWNRTTAQATVIYTGVAINNNATLATVNSSDAPLCLSCHDGTSLTKALKNPSNRFSVAGNTAGLANIGATNSANLGTDLRDDHPVGFNYNGTLINADTELNTLADATGDGAQFFKGNQMWCSSCHDVHDNTYGAFLITSNSASKLCLACHIK